MKSFGISSLGKFLSGLLAGVLLAGGVAYSATVNNTPEGGYLLCANIKTRAVTFPVKLSCPSGTKALEVAGVLSTPNDFVEEPIDEVSATPSAKSTKNASAKCNMDYLLQPNSDVDAGIASCTSKELNNLLQQVSSIENDPNISIEQKKKAMSILTGLVVAIQKKVKA